VRGHGVVKAAGPDPSMWVAMQRDREGFYMAVSKAAFDVVDKMLSQAYGEVKYLQEVEGETEYTLDNPVQARTNYDALYNMDKFSETGHAGICGITRSGKSTLLISLVRRFLEGGAFILYRDDGGGEFRYLAKYYPDATRVFIPEGPVDLRINLPVAIERFDWKQPGQIIDKVYRRDYPLNVIVFDSFANPEAPKMIGRFYYTLLREMLSSLQQKPSKEKMPLVFAIDELNDIAAPRSKGYTLSEEGKAFVSLALRKTGKHNVKILCTTHRLNQLMSDFRSQIDNIFLKRYAGGDAWAFLKDNLTTFNKYTYMKIWKILTTMPPAYFLYIDRQRRFDLCYFDDIPRPEVNYECQGVLGGERESRKATCPKCGFTWIYKGGRDVTRCPRCRAYIYFESEESLQ
jgi:hypothetical protein